MSARNTTVPQRLVAEGLGCAVLLISVVGSAIMAERLSSGNAALILLANTLATSATLYVLITLLAPVSGAHLNPLITLLERCHGRMATDEALGFMFVQIAGALTGVALAHLMFELPVWQTSAHERSGTGQWLGEAIATAGLTLVILQGRRAQPDALAGLVASYIAAAYWFTSSTAFANPAVTLARAFTGTFSGIRFTDVASFIFSQGVGMIAGLALARALRVAMPIDEEPPDHT